MEMQEAEIPQDPRDAGIEIEVDELPDQCADMAEAPGQQEAVGSTAEPGHDLEAAEELEAQPERMPTSEAEQEEELEIE